MSVALTLAPLRTFNEQGDRIRRGPLGGYDAKKDCWHSLTMDYTPRIHDPALKAEHDAFTLDLFANGTDFEEVEIGPDLVEAAPEGRVVSIVEARTADGERTEQGKTAKEEETFAAWLDEDVWMVFNARIGGRFAELLSAHLGKTVGNMERISEPDAIVFGPRMDNGLRAMAFVDVKWHKTFSGKTKNPKVAPVSEFTGPFDPYGAEEEFYGTLHVEDWLQLAHYHRHGQSLEATDDDFSKWGAVIGKERKLVWGRLDEPKFRRSLVEGGPAAQRSALEIYDAGFARAKQVIDSAIAVNLDPTRELLTFPQQQAECKVCPWRNVCKETLKAHGDGGHITLLPGITPPVALTYYKRGISDIGSLARLPLEGEDEATVVHIRQARVFKAGKVARNVDVDVVDLPRADIEIDFDCESDDRVYMWGVLATGRKQLGRHASRQRTEMHTFDDYTRTDDGERDVFVATWAYFQEMIAKATDGGHTIRFYHYTRYEKTQMLALAKKYRGQPGVPGVEAVTEFYASELVVDLYEVLSTQLVWPTKSHSIKELAKWIRFTWRDETPGGDQSMLWYRAACGEDPQVAAENRERVRLYNEDDVAAQLALRDWLTQLEAARRPDEKLPSVTALPAPLTAGVAH